MNGQFGVALDQAGNLYFADTLNHRVRQVTAVSTATPAPSFLITGLTPGALTTITGRNLSVNLSGVVTASELPLPTQLSGVSVTIEGTAAPVISVANAADQEQLQIQTPYEIAGKETVQIIVNNGRTASSPVSVPVRASTPSIVTLDGIFASAVRTDGTPITPLNPVTAGETLSFYCRGLGAVDPPVTSGAQSPAEPISQTTAIPEISIGGQTASVSFSGLAPGFIGLYRVEVVVPGGLTAGVADVILTINSVSSAASKLAVTN
jgi:uncharacterized protein (TIGR03437 family)